jgi:outer membrane biosynthesis protein TonB
VAKNPNLEGELIIDWSVNDKGGVEEAQINEAKSTLTDANVEACVVGKLRSWKFPSAPKGQVVKVSYPLVFTN